jgi:ubiquinone biosynthesis protein UbiJ
MSLSLLQTALLIPVEALLNRLLTLDAASAARLSALEGRTLAVFVTTPEFALYVSVRNRQLHLSPIFEGEPTASLRGSATALLQVLMQRNPVHSLAPYRVELRGSTGFVQDLQTLLRDLDMDWEFQLSRFIGDLPVAAVSTTMASGKEFVASSARAVKDNLQDYLAYECELFPSRAALELLQMQLQELALRTDRLEARIHALEIA